MLLEAAEFYTGKSGLKAGLNQKDREQNLPRINTDRRGSKEC